MLPNKFLLDSSSVTSVLNSSVKTGLVSLFFRTAGYKWYIFLTLGGRGGTRRQLYAHLYYNDGQHWFM